MEIMNAPMTRRSLLTQAGTAGIALAGLGLFGGKRAEARGPALDGTIITAAATAEALASTMYYNIINGPIYKTQLSGNAADQAYLVAGFEQEVIHYNFLTQQAGGRTLATEFYFPDGMFTDTQTTANILITLEDAFIAAYLIGIRDFSSAGLRVIAGQVMGVEAEHRALGRVIANDLSLPSVTGYAGTAESVVPPNAAANNLALERTFGAPFKSPAGLPTLNTIQDVEQALTPFISASAAQSAGFSGTAYALQTSLPSGVPSVTLNG